MGCARIRDPTNFSRLILICSAHNSDQRAFFSELNEIANNSAGHIRIVWALSQPEPHLQMGGDYHHNGRICKQLLQSVIQTDAFDVYLCGPNDFMQSQYNSLRELGCSNTHIFAEAFGPATLIRDEDTTVKPRKISWTWNLWKIWAKKTNNHSQVMAIVLNKSDSAGFFVQIFSQNHGAVDPHQMGDSH